ncbi:hypothetical protein BLNAU_1473 [Blattamonas nauphoetae]|uniref:Uncharacterized protein n=1 Tax=Blattamonas nauphoetae TaxID=2049346 RepID=A0ABQ9YI39_9EUKA|nr:hypothetical protein BLNAU_1473 [Blattamonas nauphoetae]
MQPTDAYFTLEVDTSPDSMDAMTQLLSDGPCVAIHTSNSLLDYPVTILPRLAPTSLLFTTDPLTLPFFWNSRQTTLSPNVTILPFPQHDMSYASIVIFSDSEITKRVHHSFLKKSGEAFIPYPFDRIFPNQDHFGNRIEMEITSISLPSKDLSCDEKATIVNLLNPTISEEITKAIQPHFPVVEAKALLIWKNILDAIKPTFNSSEGKGTKDDSTAKRPCFKVRLTPFLFVHYHINEIATVLNGEFRIIRSLGNIGGDGSFTFKFATLSPMKLVKDTVRSHTPHPSTILDSSHPKISITFQPSFQPPIQPTLHPTTRDRPVSVPPSLSAWPCPLSAAHSRSRNPSPPAMVATISNEVALLTTPNVNSRSHSVSESSPHPSLTGSNHSAVSSFSTTDSRLNLKATPFVPRRSQQSPPSNSSTSPALPHLADTVPFLFRNHVTTRSSSPILHHLQNPSTPIAAPSVVGDGDQFDDGLEELPHDDRDSDQIDVDGDVLYCDDDDDWETSSNADVDGEERHLVDG